MVEWSNNYSTYSYKYINLCITLNFKSSLSYTDSTRTDYGDINQDGEIEDILTELTKTNDGCIGFPAITSFNGTFDGQGYEIKNIYQHVNTSNQGTALFEKANEVKNLTLTGTIINDAWHAAGICAIGKTIINCKNYANITGHNMAAGIMAWELYGSDCTISNCENYGTITITGKSYSYAGAGGIQAVVYNSSCCIEKCRNYGDIIDATDSSLPTGGICGVVKSSTTITDCKNEGSCIGGIVSFVINGTEVYLLNCYNLGSCNNGIVNHIGGADWTTTLGLHIYNCYNLGTVSKAGFVGSLGSTCAEINLNIKNCYNAGTSSNAIIGSISTDSRTTRTINISNTYYDTSKSTSVGATSDGITALTESDIKNNSSFVETLNNNIGENTDWATWVLGNDGYPTFE